MADLVPLIVLVALLAWREWSNTRERAEERAAFAGERREWVRERRDLNNRIQVPEAAPFMVDEDDDERDEGAEVDPEMIERAQELLEQTGYEEGPVG